MVNYFAILILAVFLSGGCGHKTPPTASAGVQTGEVIRDIAQQATATGKAIDDAMRVVGLVKPETWEADKATLSVHLSDAKGSNDGVLKSTVQAGHLAARDSSQLAALQAEIARFKSKDSTQAQLNHWAIFAFIGGGVLLILGFVPSIPTGIFTNSIKSAGAGLIALGFLLILLGQFVALLQSIFPWIAGAAGVATAVWIGHWLWLHRVEVKQNQLIAETPIGGVVSAVNNPDDGTKTIVQKVNVTKV